MSLTRPRSSNRVLDAAEAVFRPATASPVKVELAPKAASPVPGAKEAISLRVDQNVLAFFQADGPGWQERMVAVLRQAAGL